MSKGLLNIFILLVACVALTVAPVNSEVLKLNISNKNAPVKENQSKQISGEAPVFALVPLLPSGSTLSKASSISFEVSANDIRKNGKSVLEAVEVTLSKGDSPIFTKSAANLKAKLTLKANDKTNSIGRIKIPLSFNGYNLISGNYKLTVKNSTVNEANQIAYNIVYVDKKTYAKAFFKGPSSYTVYQPEHKAALLVPFSYSGIYEYMASRSMKEIVSRTLPENFKMPKKKIALYNAEYTLNGKVLNIDFSSKNISDKGLARSDNTLILRGIVETALSNNQIDRVVLTVDGINDITVLNSKLTTNTFTDSGKKGKYIYVGFVNDSKRLMILPYSLSEAQKSMGITKKSSSPKSLINTLKSATFPALSGAAMINTVPQSVKLVDYKTSGRKITLDFNTAFLNSFGQDPDYVNLMIDSIVNTFTDSGKYTSVSFTVNGKPVISIGKVGIENQYFRLDHINPQ